MSVQIIMDRDVYLDSPVTPVTLTNAIYAGDADAQRIRFRCFQKHGQIAPMDLSEITITAHFIRPDGGDVVITGTGGSTYSYVDLPEACYVYPGIFKLLVRASTTDPDVVTSILYVTGRIDKPTTDVIIDPGTTIPSLEDLLAQIDACEAAEEAANAAAASATAAAAAGVRTDTDAQGLTDTQKANARTNIGAADADTVSQLSEEITNAIENDNYAVFADITGKYVKSDGSLANNSYLRCSDFVRVPTGAITATQYCYYTRPADSVLSDYNPLCVFFEEDKATVVDYIQKTGHVNGYKTFNIPAGSKYVRFNVSQLEPDQSNVLFRFNGATIEIIDQQIKQKVPEEFGFIGHYTGTFSAKESLNTGITLEAGKTYHIVNNTVLSKRINVYRDGAASDSKSIYPQYNYVNFTNGSADGNLMLYNSQSNLDAVDIDVYARNSVSERTAQIGNVYVVSKSNLLADFTSVTDCFLALKNDYSQKTIYIDEGEYDIFQEYIDAEVPVSQTVGDFWDYCVWTPNNSHIIGRGRVSLKWMPDPATDNITVAQCDAVSPLNVAGNVVVENLEIYCKNGRYCIHNDTLQQVFYSKRSLPVFQYFERSGILRAYMVFDKRCNIDNSNER